MTVTVRDYPVIDQPTFPKPGPAYRASLDFTLRWTALGEVVNYSQPKLKYKLAFRQAKCQLSYTARIPSVRFGLRHDGHRTQRRVLLGSNRAAAHLTMRNM